jgi:hypothetical protein
MSEPLKHAEETYAIEVTEPDGSTHYMMGTQSDCGVVTSTSRAYMCGTIGLSHESIKQYVKLKDGRTLTIVRVRKTVERIY